MQTKEGKDIYFSDKTNQWQYLFNNKPVKKEDLTLSGKLTGFLKSLF